MNLKTLFPHASNSFLSLHGFSPDRPLAPRLPDAQPKSVARQKPLDTDQAQKAGAGRTLVCITRFGPRLLDKDNLYGGVKPLCDALRYAGYIRDDTPDDILLIVRQRKTKAIPDKVQYGTQIIIYPCAP